MGLLIDDLLPFSRMGRHAMSFQLPGTGARVRLIIREPGPEAAGRNSEWRIIARHSSRTWAEGKPD